MKTNTEPAITVGSIGAVIAALLTVLVNFGVPLSDAQAAAIMGLVAVIAPIAVAIVTRQFVVPVAKLDPAPSPAPAATPTDGGEATPSVDQGGTVYDGDDAHGDTDDDSQPSDQETSGEVDPNKADG